MKTSFVGATYKGRSISVDAQECINFYPEYADSQDSKSQISLIGTPGLVLLTSTTVLGSNRGMFTSGNERLFVVIANKFIEIKSDLSSKVWGNLQTNKGPVQFAEIETSSGSQVMCVDGVGGYIFVTETNKFTRITGDYQAGNSVTSMNGFFIQNIADTSTFIYSNQYDGKTWQASLNFFKTESNPDPIVSIATINSELWFFGSKTTEIWYYTGNSQSLFNRIPPGFINIGVESVSAVATINNSVFWLGSNVQGNGIVWMASGYVPTRISTHAIEYIISQLQDNHCISYTYQQEGHMFYVMNFLAGNRTLVYDVSSQLWHERGSFNVLTGKNEHHRVVTSTLWQDKVLCGDFANNNIYYYDLDAYTDNGNTIKRQRAAVHIHNDRKRIFFQEFEIDMQRGVGIQSDQSNTSPIIPQPNKVYYFNGATPEDSIDERVDSGYYIDSISELTAGSDGIQETNTVAALDETVDTSLYVDNNDESQTDLDILDERT
jgi:Phage stabilisation protein